MAHFRDVLESATAPCIYDRAFDVYVRKRIHMLVLKEHSTTPITNPEDKTLYGLGAHAGPVAPCRNVPNFCRTFLRQLRLRLAGILNANAPQRDREVDALLRRPCDGGTELFSRSKWVWKELSAKAWTPGLAFKRMAEIIVHDIIVLSRRHGNYTNPQFKHLVCGRTRRWKPENTRGSETFGAWLFTIGEIHQKLTADTFDQPWQHSVLVVEQSEDHYEARWFILLRAFIPSS